MLQRSTTAQQVAGILNKQGISALTALIRNEREIDLPADIFSLLIERYAAEALIIKNALDANPGTSSHRLIGRPGDECPCPNDALNICCAVWMAIGFLFAVCTAITALALYEGHKDSKAKAKPLFIPFLVVALTCCCLPIIICFMTCCNPAWFSDTMRLRQQRHELKTEYATLKKDMCAVIQAIKEKQVMPTAKDIAFARSSELFSTSILTALRNAPTAEIAWSEYFSSSVNSLWNRITQNDTQLTQNFLQQTAQV